MNENKSQLATFRVDPALWEAFKAQARKNGKTATDVLNDFVQSYAASEIVPTETPRTDSLDYRIENKVIEAIAPIRQELAELKAALEQQQQPGKSRKAA